ncbi:MAG TPA: LuxR C-terminal-related transcriptional regulator, partial [Iamia sp.]
MTCEPEQTSVLDDAPSGCRASEAASRGELRRSEMLAREVLAHADAEPGEAAGAHLALAIVARERDRPDDARRELGAAIRSAERVGCSGTVTLARLEQALVASSGGAHLEAIGTVVDVDRRLGPPGAEPGLRPVVDAVDALVHFAAGDVDRAEVLIERLPTGPVRALLGARIALARGRIEAALATVERMRRDGQHDLRHRIEALVLASRAEAARGAHQAARRRLADLAELTRPEGYVRVYRDLGVEPPGGSPRHDGDGPTWIGLSAREQQVLRHLVDRRDNREIAEAMFISVNTVKT